MKLNVRHTLQRTATFVVRYKVILVWLIVLGLLGLTLWRLQSISNPEPDTQHIKMQRDNPENQVVEIKLSDDLRREIDRLRPNPVDVDPNQLGTQDPFNP